MAIMQANLRQHLQFKTGGFCWCKVSAHMPLLTATSTFGLGKRRRGCTGAGYVPLCQLLR